jgi:hypothetical protein
MLLQDYETEHREMFHIPQNKTLKLMWHFLKEWDQTQHWEWPYTCVLKISIIIFIDPVISKEIKNVRKAGKSQSQEFRPTRKASRSCKI